MSILEAAPQIGIPTSQDPILPEELFTADEIFTSHSGIKVCPVTRFEDRTLQAPGPVSAQLIELLDNITNFKDDRFKDWFTPLY
jgi:branched-chain amino acid aminotransferase